jgi:hypothetical protein
MIFILSVLATIVALIVWQGALRKVRQNNITFKPIAKAGILAAGVFGTVALLQLFTQIPAGHVGVVDFFGVVSDKTLSAGINPVNPIFHSDTRA